MFCPQCLSGDVLAERSDSRRYRSRHYSTIALVLDYLDHRNQKRRFQEDGPLCECLHCGFCWRPKQAERQKRYAQILTQQLGAAYSNIKYCSPDECTLLLEQDAVVLLFPKGKYYRVDYSELAGVSFQRSIGPLYGWLTIHDRIHAKRRMPQNFEQARKERCTVLCDFADENAIYHIYLALQKIVEENKKAGLFPQK